VASAGEYLGHALKQMAAKHPAVRDVRGAGLIWGIELDRPAAPVVEAALNLGLLVNRTADTVVRLLPPFIITRLDIDEAVGLLDKALATAAGGAQ
jgi:acetylornithine/succinyldiaminopimelate/putrescine aminotransferase